MRRRIAALVVAFAALGTVGATAARAATPATPIHDKPWACVGEKDIHVSVCLYTPVPDPPKQ